MKKICGRKKNVADEKQKFDSENYIFTSVETSSELCTGIVVNFQLKYFPSLQDRIFDQQ